jgi:glycerol-3-phosphate dehydrogenase (NAD(P)+)
MKKSISILGGGAWGTAVATLFAENGHEVLLWCHEPEVVETIKTERINKQYLPGISLHKNIKPTNNLEEAVTGAEIIFEAIPVEFMRSILEQAKPFVTKEKIWGVLSKGIEQETLLLPTDILDNVFGYETKKVVVGGPNFAHELANKCITASLVASKDKDIVKLFCDMMKNNYFKPYCSEDIVGVQVGGALKNVIAIVMGMAMGIDYKENTRAFLVTRGLSEMGFISEKLGGKRGTVSGLSGMGDLILSSLDCTARNCKIGILLSGGKKLDELKTTMPVLPEGVNTTKSLYALIQKHDWDLPLCKGIYEILFDGKTLKQVVEGIVAGPVSTEF